MGGCRPKLRNARLLMVLAGSQRYVNNFAEAQGYRSSKFKSIREKGGRGRLQSREVEHKAL